MGRNQGLRVAWIIAVLCLSACKQADPPSLIVQKLEAAGSGDLTKTSADSIRQWLGPRRQLAIDVEDLCKAVRSRATASWTETTEGRVCAASAELAFYRYTPGQGDGKTYKSGDK
jgi:hypothetical protein